MNLSIGQVLIVSITPYFLEKGHFVVPLLLTLRARFASLFRHLSVSNVFPLSAGKPVFLDGETMFFPDPLL